MICSDRFNLTTRKSFQTLENFSGVVRLDLNAVMALLTSVGYRIGAKVAEVPAESRHHEPQQVVSVARCNWIPSVNPLAGFWLWTTGEFITRFCALSGVEAGAREIASSECIAGLQGKSAGVTGALGNKCSGYARSV